MLHTHQIKFENQGMSPQEGIPHDKGIMVRKIRITLATLFFVGITLMFLDFTGTLHLYLDWMARLQFWPALLGLSLVPLVLILLFTVVFGRIYCSVICPLGVFQDIIAHIGRIGKRNPYKYSNEKRWLRCGFLAVMLCLIPLGMTSILAPYSAYGRIANTLFRPLWVWCNNLLAGIAEHYESYLFYRADVLLTTGVTLAVAVTTLVVVTVLAFRNGRTYCNTVCPVGTILGVISKEARFKVSIDAEKCKNCRKCERNCKAACIDIKNHKVDYSRCVVCGDCLGQCSFGAISYGNKPKKGCSAKTENTDTEHSNGRRSALAGMAMVAATAAVAQEKKKVDGGLAVIEDKQQPKRRTQILPPGSGSEKHFHHHCTSCQLCVSACPNKVLRPSTSLDHFMQPYMSYEDGYCRPECHACSSVCPANAIEDIGIEVKASTKIGTAVFLKKNCVSLEGDFECGNCARHCPTGAIEMVPSDPDDETSPLMPAVNEERCIGCGACEYLCPARPFSAIYVEGIEQQREV